jgi:hypothetical protein
MTIKTLAAGVALAVAMAAGAAQASTPLVLDAGWSQFSFGGVASSFSTDYSFTLAGPAVLKVTDAYLDGDQFDITINGVDQGPTSTPVNDGTTVDSDFDAAFASPKFSHAAYNLGAGTYDVTGTVVQSPYGGGGAGIELSSPVAGVPEPATWGMMILGFLGLGAALRTGRRSQVATA